MEARYAPELVADPVHRLMNRCTSSPTYSSASALFAWGGWPLVIWGVFLRIVFGLHCTWLVNSATHTWGYRTCETNEDSRNLWWVGLLAFGEGWHNNHHAFQRSARHGLAWWEFDANWVFIRTMAALGLIREIQLLPKNAERFRIGTGVMVPASPPRSRRVTLLVRVVTHRGRLAPCLSPPVETGSK